MRCHSQTKAAGSSTGLASRIALLLVVASVGIAPTAGAQPGAGLDGRGSLIRTFEANAPAIGAPMPDLPVYDRDGREARLPELLDGRLTVLVLGCLT